MRTQRDTSVSNKDGQESIGLQSSKEAVTGRDVGGNNAFTVGNFGHVTCKAERGNNPSKVKVFATQDGLHTFFHQDYSFFSAASQRRNE